MANNLTSRITALEQKSRNESNQLIVISVEGVLTDEQKEQILTAEKQGREVKHIIITAGKQGESHHDNT